MILNIEESSNFRANLVAPSHKSLMDSLASSKGNQIRVLVEDLLVIEGFNPRTPGPELEAHIRDLANKILANGFYDHKPLSCAGGFRGKKPVLYVHDGHCRLAAVKLAISEGAQIDDLPVVIKDRSCSEEDLLVGMVNSNEGRPLSALELAIVCKRLLGFGWNASRIAQSISKTDDYVGKLLILAGAPKAIREMVEQGKVSAALATQALVRHGNEAAEMLQKGIDHAKALGQDKLKPRYMPDQVRRRAVAAAAPRMATALHQVVRHPKFSELPADLRALLEGALKDVPAEQEPAEATEAEREFAKRQLQLVGVAA